MAYDVIPLPWAKIKLAFILKCMMNKIRKRRLITAGHEKMLPRVQ